MSDTDVLIIGGGVSGLAIAECLAQSRIRTEVWEKASHPGGKIKSVARGGYLAEESATMLLNFRPEVARFIDRADLTGQKTPRAEIKRRYVIHRDRLTELPMSIRRLLASDIWSTGGKLRMLLEPFIISRNSGNETVSQFVSRRLGREVLDKTIGPYVAGLLASDPDEADARSVLPRLVALEKRYGSIAMGVLVHRLLKRKSATETEAFSFAGGMQALVSSLAMRDGVSFRGGHEVTRLSRCAEGWAAIAQTSGGERSIRAKQVVICTPAHNAGALVAKQSDELSRLLSNIRYAGIAVLHTGFSRDAIAHPLDGNGFLTPTDHGTSLTGCMWVSSLFKDRAPPGKVLLTNYLGGARHPGVTGKSRQQLLDEAMYTLRPLLGIRGEPEFLHIDRHQNGLPLYHCNHHGRMRQLERELAQHPGLHVEANYRGGISVRDRIVMATKAADRIRGELQASRSKIYSVPNMALRPRVS